MQENKLTVLLGVGGGIAAYKTIELASLIKKAGYNVFASMTESACKFVTPLTFESTTGNIVSSSIFPAKNDANKYNTFPHLYPATETDVYIIAPATANLIAKIAHGIGDNVVSANALSLPVNSLRIFCPAMNVNMWENPVTQANVRILEESGWVRIGPESGLQACGAIGFGRMSEAKDIFSKLSELLANRNKLNKKKVLIFSGPTREYIDSVRYISNASSGKMGKSLAETAANLGAEVEFITGVVSEENLPRNSFIKIHKISSTEEMFKKGQELFSKSDIIIFTAAVSDYKPMQAKENKIPSKMNELNLQLIPTVDISKELAKTKKNNQICIGFSLDKSIDNNKASEKLTSKNLDGIVINSLESMNSETAEFNFISSDGQLKSWGNISKNKCAGNIFEFIISKS